MVEVEQHRTTDHREHPMHQEIVRAPLGNVNVGHAARSYRKRPTLSTRQGGGDHAIFVVMTEIIFIVAESPEGGYEARALEHSIFTDGDDLEQLKANVKDAVATHFDTDHMPKIIRLHMVKEIVIAA